MKKHNLQDWVPAIAWGVILLVLIGGIVYVFIDVISSTYTYRTFSGHVGVSNNCYSKYGNYSCVTEDGGMIRVEMYRKHNGR